MPLDEAGARSWRLQCLRPRVTLSQPETNVIDLYATDVGYEALEDTLPRIRRLEKALALAAERAFNDGKIDQAISLRREHVAAIKALYDAESKAIRISESRGRLISVERALAMINEAMQSAIFVLRRLPELARDSDQRRALEAFLNGVLAEIKTGAAEGIRKSASP
jgi:hypothetical protein